MSNEENFKLLRIQTTMLKVHIHCEGCKKKVKKILQKIEGVYEVAVEEDIHKVTVVGNNLRSEDLIRKLTRAGKPAELWPSNTGKANQQKQQHHDQKKVHFDLVLDEKPQKGQKGGGDMDQKPQKGGGGAGMKGGDAGMALLEEFLGKEVKEKMNLGGKDKSNGSTPVKDKSNNNGGGNNEDGGSAKKDNGGGGKKNGGDGQNNKGGNGGKNKGGGAGNNGGGEAEFKNQNNGGGGGGKKGGNQGEQQNQNQQGSGKKKGKGGGGGGGGGGVVDAFADFDGEDVDAFFEESNFATPEGKNPNPGGGGGGGNKNAGNSNNSGKKGGGKKNDNININAINDWESEGSSFDGLDFGGGGIGFPQAVMNGAAAGPGMGFPGGGGGGAAAAAAALAAHNSFGGFGGPGAPGFPPPSMNPPHSQIHAAAFAPASATGPGYPAGGAGTPFGGMVPPHHQQLVHHHHHAGYGMAPPPAAAYPAAGPGPVPNPGYSYYGGGAGFEYGGHGLHYNPAYRHMGDNRAAMMMPYRSPYPVQHYGSSSTDDATHIFSDENTNSCSVM